MFDLEKRSMFVQLVGRAHSIVRNLDVVTEPLSQTSTRTFDWQPAIERHNQRVIVALLAFYTHDDDLIGPDAQARDRRLPWAELLRRTFAIDIFTCGRCGGATRIVAAICEERVARQILEHLRLPSRAPPRGKPWRPGAEQLDLLWRHHEFDGIDSVPNDD